MQFALEESQELDPVTQTFGSVFSFKKYQPIGRGSYGVVYKARVTDRQDLTGGNVVAVKSVCIDKEVSENAEKRAALLKKLKDLLDIKHPHLVGYHQLSIISHGDALSEYKLVMDYYKESGEGSVYFTNRRDFGDSVRMRRNVATPNDITRLRGSFRYMSPEMLRKYYAYRTEEIIGRKTDVWSLGCVLLDLIYAGVKKRFLYKEYSGDVLHADHSEMPDNRFADMVIDGYVPYIPNTVSGFLSDNIRKCLCRKSQDRISAGCFLQLIRDKLLETHTTGDDSVRSLSKIWGESQLLKAPSHHQSNDDSVIRIPDSSQLRPATCKDQNSSRASLENEVMEVNLNQNWEKFIIEYLNKRTPAISAALVNDIKTRGGDSVRDCLMHFHNGWERALFHVAIIGQSRSGKSSLINALRRLSWDSKDDRKIWADISNTTQNPTAYAHPKHPKLKIWDLPGLNVSSDMTNYLEQMRIKEYDFFILTSSQRFGESDFELTKKLLELHKSVVFVRTHVDVDLRFMAEYGHSRWAPKIAPTPKGRKQLAALLRKELEANLMDGFENTRVNLPAKVFLIDSYSRSAFDFRKLDKEIIRRIRAAKSKAMLMMLSSLSKEIIRAKMERSKKHIKAVALASGIVGVIPLPVLVTAVDSSLLVGSYLKLRKELGLDSESLEQTAALYDIKKDELKKWVAKYIPSSDNVEILTFVERMVPPEAVAIQTVVDVLKAIPIVNMAFAPASMSRTFRATDAVRKMMGEVAANMLTKCMASTYRPWDHDAYMHVPFNIAVLGEPGSGKSSLINSLHQLHTQNQGHETLRPAVEKVGHKYNDRFTYPYPDRRRIKIWQLPSVERLSHETSETSQNVQLDTYYDLYMIVSESDFSEEDLRMASEIEKLGETPVFVRTHMDITLQRMHVDDPHTWPADHPEAEMVKHVREETEKRLRKFDADVFLVDANDRSKFDFSALQLELVRECPVENLRDGGMMLAADTRNVDGH